MYGWSPSVITAASTSPSASSPQRTEADWPSCQRAQTTVSAPSKSTAERISSAAWPSTTTTGAMAGTASIASTA
jgi:hypothetical protein